VDVFGHLKDVETGTGILKTQFRIKFITLKTRYENGEKRKELHRAAYCFGSVSELNGNSACPHSR
jgi:hypothetical protein